MTNKLRRFSRDFNKILDKSDNDGSVHSFRSAGMPGAPGQKQTQKKLMMVKSDIHSNLNEPIEEVEDMEEEGYGGN